MKQNTVPVLAFFLIAFIFSWVVNQYLPALSIGYVDVKTILTGLGPALSGLLCYRLFNTPNTYRLSLKGNKPLYSYILTFLALLLPLLMNQQPNKALLIGSIATQFIYTLGEEFGWRHYLQNATGNFSRWKQAFLIGAIWFLWHYAILDDPTTMLTGKPIPFYIGAPGLLILLSLLSHLFGGIVMRTQTILLLVLIHYIGKVGPGPMVLLIIGLILVTYLFWSKLPGKITSTAT